MEELYDQLESTELHMCPWVHAQLMHTHTHTRMCLHIRYKLATLNLVSYVNLAIHQIYHLAVLDGNTVINTTNS